MLVTFFFAFIHVPRSGYTQSAPNCRSVATGYESTFSSHGKYSAEIPRSCFSSVVDRLCKHHCKTCVVGSAPVATRSQTGKGLEWVASARERRRLGARLIFSLWRPRRQHGHLPREPWQLPFSRLSPPLTGRRARTPLYPCRDIPCEAVPEPMFLPRRNTKWARSPRFDLGGNQKGAGFARLPCLRAGASPICGSHQ